jgi:SAM-dependent methyltransferase
MSHPADGPETSAAAWDHVWSHHSYRLDRVRSERARIKVAAVLALGMEFASTDRVLDLACGSGYTLMETSARLSVRARLVGLDISAQALAQARDNFARIHLDAQLVRAQWRGLPFRTGAIDKVIAFMAPFSALISEIERVLAPGGKLFMVAPSRDSVTSAYYRVRESIRTGPWDESRNFSARELIALLGKSMVVEDWRILHSGDERPFAGALDRAIARWAPRWGRYVVVRCTKSRAR